MWVHNADCCDLNIGANNANYSNTAHKNISNRAGNGDVIDRSLSRKALGNYTIEPFNLTSSKAYKDLKTDKERKEFISHYTRQVKCQEEAINSLSPDELLSAIDAHKQSGRESPENQRAFTKKFKRNLQTTIEKSICGKPQYKNLSQAEIKKYAKDRTEEIASKLAALHDPDQVVGGHFSDIKHMGSRSNNGAIGGGWADGKRVSQLQETAEKLKKSGATKMNISLTIK